MSDNKKDLGSLTDQSHWDAAWDSSVKLRMPSRLNVGVLNITRLLKRHVFPGCRYIEIGCAPGKLLTWVANVLQANALGLDYSDAGIFQCRRLFEALNLDIDLYHEDFFNHTLELETFDVVTSFGLIEHFDDPVPVVRQHLDLVKPGGVAIITVPNYGGVYGSIQSWCDSPNLELHNLDIMTTSAMRALVDSSEVESVRAYRFGSVNPWVLNLGNKLPKFLVTMLNLGINAIGLIQPMNIGAIAPMLVLEIRKNKL